MTTITINAGERTEEVLSGFLKFITDEELDGIGIKRVKEPLPGLACEAITVYAVLTIVVAPVAMAVIRAIERYLEQRRQEANMRLVIEGAALSPEVGKQLADIAKKHSEVAISMKLSENRSLKDKAKQEGKAS